MNGWTRKWLLKLSDPNQQQIKIGLVCDNDTGERGGRQCPVQVNRHTRTQDGTLVGSIKHSSDTAYYMYLVFILYV